MPSLLPSEPAVTVCQALRNNLEASFVGCTCIRELRPDSQGLERQTSQNELAHLCGSIGPVLLLLQPFYLMGKKHILQHRHKPHFLWSSHHHGYLVRVDDMVDKYAASVFHPRDPRKHSCRLRHGFRDSGMRPCPCSRPQDAAGRLTCSSRGARLLLLRCIFRA